jgi:anthranilate synthase component 1
MSARSANPESVAEMLDLQPATFEAFEREARQGNVVPVVRSVLADLHTPVGTFMRIAGNSRYAFPARIRSRAANASPATPSSARNPTWSVRGMGFQTFVERTGKTESFPTVATEWVRDYFHQRSLARRRGLVPFAGGRRRLCRLRRGAMVSNLRCDSDETQPLTGPNGCSVDVLTHGDRVRSRGNSGWRSSPSSSRKRQAEVTSACANFTIKPLGARSNSSRQSSKAIHSRRVRHSAVNPRAISRCNQTGRDVRLKTACDASRTTSPPGDCYQAVLSQRFSTPFHGEPLQIYRALRAINPSPYIFFLRAGEETVIGASPEMLVRCHGQRLDYRPIAGTRKRGATETEDVLLGEDLRTDEKEVAEHMMLVDLWSQRSRAAFRIMAR